MFPPGAVRIAIVGSQLRPQGMVAISLLPRQSWTERGCPLTASSEMTWASAIRLRAQRREVLPNIAASLHSDSGLPASMLALYAATAATLMFSSLPAPTMSAPFPRPAGRLPFRRPVRLVQVGSFWPDGPVRAQDGADRPPDRGVIDTGWSMTPLSRPGCPARGFGRLVAGMLHRAGTADDAETQWCKVNPASVSTRAISRARGSRESPAGSRRP